jgi:hypothetical protein
MPFGKKLREIRSHPATQGYQQLLTTPVENTLIKIRLKS